MISSLETPPNKKPKLESSEPITASDTTDASDALLSKLTKYTSKMIRTPPSHILADGTYIHLPDPTCVERASFFERSVAEHRLISATKSSYKEEDDDKDDEAGGDAQDDPSSSADGKNKNLEPNDDKPQTKKEITPKIHPVAIASARLHGKGIQELSKALNLSDLVNHGEYFGMANIVNHNTISMSSKDAKKDDAKSSEDNGNDPSNVNDGTGGATTTSNPSSSSDNNDSQTTSAKNNASNNDSTTLDSAAILEEQKLRATYLLQRKKHQFAQSSEILQRHQHRLTSSIITQRLLDLRLLEIRQRWRLVAPEHGTRAIGPVRPTEVVAIDVEVYDRDRMGGGSVAATSLNNSLNHNIYNESGAGVDGSSGGGKNNNDMDNRNSLNRLGRIARMVPRYATIEIRKEFLLDRKDWLSTNTDQSPSTTLPASTNDNSNSVAPVDVDSTTTKSDDTKLNDEQEKERNRNYTKKIESTCQYTRSEPFAVADPTLGKIDPDFDPDKVPILTLLLSIEKASTGYVQNCTLSSSSCSSHDHNEDAKEEHLSQDEKVITTLQHSLFCASLFESIRREITTNIQNDIQSTATTSNKSNLPSKFGSNNTNTTAPPTSSSLSSSTQSQSTPSVWLSDGMEEVFLPPPSLMVGGRAHSSSNASNSSMTGGGLCVIHCHESEVKVQLDSEYSITIQLIEAGTSLDATTNHIKTTDNKASTNNQDHPNRSSGSQTSDQLQVLCRTLLLQAQFLYHDHCMKTRTQNLSSKNAANKSTAPKVANSKPIYGSNHQLQQQLRAQEKIALPHILEQSVALGSKIIFERKVRSTLQRLSKWMKQQANKLQTHDIVIPKPLFTLEWLPLSLFDPNSHFVLSVADHAFCIDVSLHGGEMVVSQIGKEGGGYQRVGFKSADEFEHFVKFQIKRFVFP